MEWLKDIKKEELPDLYQDMLRILVHGDPDRNPPIMPSVKDEVSGLAIIISLATHYNKQGFYFSGIDAVISKKKREFVLKNRGRRVAELARITGFSERTIYDIYEEAAKIRQRDLFTAEAQIRGEKANDQ